MLSSIISFSIRNKVLVGLSVLLLIGAGIYNVRQLPIDAVPDITNNQVQIITVAPTLAAPDVERLVTFPVEQTMSTIAGIAELRSFSRFGLSVVTLVFKDEKDLYWARAQVNDRLNLAKSQIPAGVGSPEMGPISTGLGEIYQYVVRAKKGYEAKYDLMELRTLQDWIVRRQLLQVEGVAEVASWGGFLKQYEVAVQPARLKSLGISLSDIFHALEANNQNTGGAYIEQNPYAYFIRSEGMLRNEDDIKKIVVKKIPNKTPITIADAAEVHIGHANRYGAVTENGAEVTGAVVMMLRGENSSRVIARIKERIEAIQKTLPQGVEIHPYLDRTKLVKQAVRTVSTNLLEGALIVIFVLVLMLGNFRAGIIVASVIPLSMLFAIILMNFFGVSGNLMSLGAIDFGLIVDGAIIIVEATLHYLGSQQVFRTLTQTEMNTEVEKSATHMMRSALFGQLIILMVYLPIFTLQGIEGKMFRPMAQTVAFALVGAIILCITYVPMMTSLLIKRQTGSHASFALSEKIFEKIQVYYLPMLRYSLHHRKPILITTIVVFCASLFLFTRLGGEFIPTLDEGDFAVETRLLTGSSLSQSIETTMKGAQVLRKNFPEVLNVVGKIGTSEVPTDPMPVESSDLIILLKNQKEWTSASSREALAQKMADTLKAHLPGVMFGFQQPIQMRFNELMTGARQDVVVKIFGEDLEKLSRYGEQIGQLAQTIEGVQDVFVEPMNGLPQVVIRYHRDKLLQYGLSIQDLNQLVRTGFSGEAAGLIFENERRFDLVVRWQESNRKKIDDIRNTPVQLSESVYLPLGQIADVQIEMGPNQIQHDNAKRRLAVGFNTRGRDVESIVQELQKKIEKEITWSPGYYVQYGGSFQNLIQARARLLIVVPITLFLIYGLLYIAFGSFAYSAVIFSAIPLSAIGGVLALWTRGLPFSISAGVGFIALFGVAVLNGIVLLSECQKLRRENKSLLEAATEGALTRLRPVLMTAAVASLGFLPMALATSTGAEVQRPLATVVIGGIISSTFLTLVILPVLFTMTGKKGE